MSFEGVVCTPLKVDFFLSVFLTLPHSDLFQIQEKVSYIFLSYPRYQNVCFNISSS